MFEMQTKHFVVGGGRGNSHTGKTITIW